MDDTVTLLEAVRSGDAAQVEALLTGNPGLIEARSDTGITPVLMAVYYGHPELVPVLRKHGVELSLWEAAAVGDVESAQQRLDEAPAHLGEYSADGWAPLHLAVFFGHAPVAALLLERGADTTLISRNPMGVTPLQSALARGSEESVALLIEHGADVRGGAPTSWPPLAYAAANRLNVSARLLLEKGADLNARTPDGKTPLALAIENENEELAELLREHGATE